MKGLTSIDLVDTQLKNVQFLKYFNAEMKMDIVLWNFWKDLSLQYKFGDQHANIFKVMILG